MPAITSFARKRVSVARVKGVGDMVVSAVASAAVPVVVASAAVEAVVSAAVALEVAGR